MNLVYFVTPAHENYWNIEPLCESCLVIDTPTCTSFPVCEICNNETRTPNFGDDLIIYFVDMLLLIYSNGYVSCIPNARPYSLFPGEV